MSLRSPAKSHFRSIWNNSKTYPKLFENKLISFLFGGKKIEAPATSEKSRIRILGNRASKAFTPAPKALTSRIVSPLQTNKIAARQTYLSQDTTV